MNTNDLLNELTNKIAVSGFEHDFAHYLKEKLLEYCDDAWIDEIGSTIGVKKCGVDGAKKIMFEAHLDQIGLIVSEIHDGGFVSFDNLGGTDERILPASEVYIGKDMLYGVIGHKPPHLSSGEDKSAKISDLLIDTGYTKEELQKKIKTGDHIVLKSKYANLLNNKASCSAMDNRASIVAVLKCLDIMSTMTLDFDLYVLFSTQEELGLYGAYGATSSIMPDLAVVIDVTHGTTPDAKEQDGVFELGSGAIICRGPNLHYDITKKLINFAEENKFRYDIEVASGSSGTTAWAIQTTHTGVPVTLVSIPLRYMHTTVEMLELSDIDSVCGLVCAFLTQEGSNAVC